MKIALCQINPTVGAIKQNKELILKKYQEAINLGAELIVFPELALIGYPPQDLLLRNKFINNAEIALDEIEAVNPGGATAGPSKKERNNQFRG